jgi:tetratricopeptide (TPR) repeat protein
LGETLPTVSARRSVDARRLGPSLRGELDWIVMKALEKDRRRRYETANDFASDVTRYLADQPVQACPPSVGYRLRKFVRRNKGPVAAGVALAALLVLGTMGTSMGLVWALQAERKARTAEELARDRLLEVTKEKERATAAEGQAKEEADIATAVRDFLQNDLLAQAAPDRNARSKKVTVDEVLGRAAARIAGKFAQQPRVEAQIRVTIGETYSALGDFTAAQPHLERAWEIGRRVLGEEHPDTLLLLHYVESLYRSQGKLAQAEPLIIEGLELSRRVLGQEHGLTLAFTSNLADICASKGQFDRAEALRADVLEVSRRVQGEEHLNTLRFMIALAGLYEQQGRWAQAESLYVEALAAMRRVLGEEHPDTLKTMNDLGLLYQNQRQYARAEALLRKTAEVTRRVLGEEHRDTLIAMDNVIMPCVDQGKFAEAERLYLHSLEVHRRVQGEEYPATLNIMHGLGWFYANQGKPTKAEPLLVRALELGRRVKGETHPDTRRTADNLAYVYWCNMKFDRSIALLEDRLKWTRAEQGPDHLNTLETMADLARSYCDAGRLADATGLLEHARARALKQPGFPVDKLAAISSGLAEAYETAGQYAKAESLYYETLETVRRRHEEASYWSSYLKYRLARNILKQQRHAEAEPLLRECVSFHEHNTRGLRRWEIFSTKSALGGSLLGQKKYAEAEPMLLAGYEGLKRCEGEIPPVSRVRVTEAIERLVQFYEVTGKKDKAAEWRAKLPAAKSAKPSETKKP